MGGRPGEELMHRLDMPISDDTILRQLDRGNRVSYILRDRNAIE